MENTERLCMKCMTHGLGAGGAVCAHCGADETKLWIAPHHLKPRSILNGKYVAGQVIGEGGFGITYVGWDTVLSLKVAIKEYYPSGFVTRDSTVSTTVHAFSGDKGEFYTKGRERFIKEAQRLARFFGLPGIVSVRDFFTENGTAYIVMEFVEGATMKTVLANMRGRMPEAHVLEVMKPLVRSLASMHKAGIIHRDIAPDNIMIQPDGSVKLLDFGAAKEITSDGKSATVLIKHGYAPAEQYFSDITRQGPWTDVYALCATIFRAIDGDTPPDAIARLSGDTFQGFTAPVSENTRRAVMKGLAVAAENRWQDMDQLARELYPASTQFPGPIGPITYAGAIPEAGPQPDTAGPKPGPASKPDPRGPESGPDAPGTDAKAGRKREPLIKLKPKAKREPEPRPKPDPGQPRPAASLAQPPPETRVPLMVGGIAALICVITSLIVLGSGYSSGSVPLPGVALVCGAALWLASRRPDGGARTAALVLGALASLYTLVTIQGILYESSNSTSDLPGMTATLGSALLAAAFVWIAAKSKKKINEVGADGVSAPGRPGHRRLLLICAATVVFCLIVAALTQSATPDTPINPPPPANMPDSESDPPPSPAGEPPADAAADPAAITPAAPEPDLAAADYLPGEEANGLEYDYRYFEKQFFPDGTVAEDVRLLEVLRFEPVENGSIHKLSFSNALRSGSLYLYSENGSITLLSAPSGMAERFELYFASGQLDEIIDEFLGYGYPVFGAPGTDYTKELENGTTVSASFSAGTGPLNGKPQIIGSLMFDYLDSEESTAVRYVWEEGTGLAEYTRERRDGAGAVIFYESDILPGYTPTLAPPRQSAAETDWSDYDIHLLGPEVPPMTQALAEAMEQAYGSSVSYAASGSYGPYRDGDVANMRALSFAEDFLTDESDFLSGMLILGIPDYGYNTGTDFLAEIGLDNSNWYNLMSFNYDGNRWSFLVGEYAEERALLELLPADFSDPQSPLRTAFDEAYAALNAALN